MRRSLLTLLLLVLAAPTWAFTFGTTCANPCGVEEIVAGSTTICTITVGAVPVPLIVSDAHYLVHHAAGDEFVDAAGTPVRVPAGSSVDFRLTIATDASDTGRLTMDAVAEVTELGPSEIATLGDAVTIVPISTCAITTTSLPPVTTTTTTSTTTTTVQQILGFPRFKVCAHNGMPKKCD